MSDVNHLEDLKQDPENARKHNPRNIGMITSSLHSVGAGRSIVIDEDNVILSGNGVYEAAVNAGIENVQVVEADGETIIAVRRSNLTPEQKKKLAYFDNRTAELAGWSAEQLLADLDAGVELGEMWFDWELEKLVDGLEDEPIDPNQEWQGMPEFEQEDLTAAYSIKVHLKTLDDLNAFAELVGQKLTEKVRSIWYPEAEMEREFDKRYISES